MKPTFSLNLNHKPVFPALGVIALAGSIGFIAKFWPLVISVFFAGIKIYIAASLFLDRFTF